MLKKVTFTVVILCLMTTIILANNLNPAPNIPNSGGLKKIDRLYSGYTMKEIYQVFGKPRETNVERFFRRGRILHYMWKYKNVEIFFDCKKKLYIIKCKVPSKTKFKLKNTLPPILLTKGYSSHSYHLGPAFNNFVPGISVLLTFNLKIKRDKSGFIERKIATQSVKIECIAPRSAVIKQFNIKKGGYTTTLDMRRWKNFYLRTYTEKGPYQYSK